ncbi:pyridoxal phosphate-dependent transferase [Circinella umbellata]|nr:pyridoxal phosphate-dependent transferase [Circinella umbellata]
MVNFLEGQPSLDLLSSDRVARAASLAFKLPDAVPTMLQYNGFIGDPGFLKNLATFLSKAYNDKVEVNNLCCSPGASLMIEHVLTILTRPQSTTKYAFFQNPTYHFGFRIFQDAGFSKNQFVGVPDDANGLNIDFLESSLKEKFGSGSDTTDDYYNAVLYCVPTHGNPSSSILSEERREKLVKLAKQYNVLIICDDVYDLLTYQGIAPKRVVAYDLESNSKPVVISNCSFSKILAPGMRVGWVEAHETLVKRLGLSGSFISGSNPANFSSIIVSQMLNSDDPQVNLQTNIDHLKVVLHERLIEGLWKPYQELLEPIGCYASLPTGGYFMWMRLPPGINVTLLDEIITERNIDVRLGSGNLFATPGPQPTDEFSNYLRLCFAHYSKEELREGMKTVEEVIRLAQERKKNSL